MDMRIALACLLLATVAAFAQAPSKPVPQDLIKADEAFGKASLERGLDGWLSYFDAGAVIFPSGGEIVKGLVAVRAHYAAKKWDPEGLTWKPLGAELAASGDLGYTYGTWLWQGKDKDGNPASVTGKYLTTWKRQKDGSWKVLADIGAPDAVKK
jgi:ketosteroid isomerase-like protein